ncbi:MAG: hypothetical protein QXP36_04840 [Conexivisphaerales archaeon]
MGEKMTELLPEFSTPFEQESEKIREELERESEEVKELIKTDDEKIKEKITELHNTIVTQDALRPGLNKLYYAIIDYTKLFGDEEALKVLRDFYDEIYMLNDDIQETLKEMYNIVNDQKKKKNNKNELLPLTINLFRQYGIIRRLYHALGEFNKIRESKVYNGVGENSLGTLLHIRLFGSLRFLLELLLES